LFPAVLASTVFGLCNIFARGASVLAPLVAEIPKPIPLIIFAILTAIAIILSLFLQTPKNKF
jgi:hypothetical protein